MTLFYQKLRCSTNLKNCQDINFWNYFGVFAVQLDAEVGTGRVCIIVYGRAFIIICISKTKVGMTYKKIFEKDIMSWLPNVQPIYNISEIQSSL